MSKRRSFLSLRSNSSPHSTSTTSDLFPHRRIRPHQDSDPITAAADDYDDDDDDRWSRMLPELLGEIIRRVESSDDRWPVRKNVVACACVCRRWRHITTALVGSPRDTGLITFPSSLKQSGPKELPIQCFIKRNKKNSTFSLFLSLTQTFMDKGKFLLAARRFRHGAHTEYVISLDVDDLSQGSNAYLGKLRSDFLGTKFTIYDSRPPSNSPNLSRSRTSRRFASKQISPQVPASNFEVGHIFYKFNILKSRGPRRMLCTLQCPTAEETTTSEEKEESCKKENTAQSDRSVVLRNKSPRWHEHLQCWCLNFHGRVTVASVKNFQLVAAPESLGGVGDDETVLLQFGKVGDDLFTMDYRQPLSAFQAFAICLTSFGTKFACE